MVLAGDADQSANPILEDAGTFRESNPRTKKSRWPYLLEEGVHSLSGNVRAIARISASTRSFRESGETTLADEPQLRIHGLSSR